LQSEAWRPFGGRTRRPAPDDAAEEEEEERNEEQDTVQQITIQGTP